MLVVPPIVLREEGGGFIGTNKRKGSYLIAGVIICNLKTILLLYYFSVTISELHSGIPVILHPFYP